MAGTGRGRGGGRKKLCLLSGTNEAKDQVAGMESVEQKREYDFPRGILEIIISLLTLRDNIRASAVCKTWLDVAIFIRNADKPPLLMLFPKFDDLYEFYDPSKRKSYWLRLPEIHNSKFFYGRDGWLLLEEPTDGTLFLFSPYTRETIILPDLNFSFLSVAFSAAPTSPNCILFAIKTDLHIAMCRPGETKWTTVNYQTSLPIHRFWDKFVSYRGLFYCLKFPLRLGIYNPNTVTWTEYSLPPPSCSQKLWNYGRGEMKHMIQHNGDVYVVETYSNEDLKIYKLDLTKKVWSNIETLGEITLFANCLSSLARADLRTMRNQVYFPEGQNYGRHCVSYYLDDRTYYPKNEGYDSYTEDMGDMEDMEDLPKSIWIEPPENFSVFH